MPADLPSLNRLTADVATAMHAAERARPARWWRRLPPLVVALAALAVPSAVALHLTAGDSSGETDHAHDRVVHVPGVRPPKTAVAIARDVVNGHQATFAAFRCDGGKTVAIALLVTGGASVGRCARALGATPDATDALRASAFWSPGQTWIHGLARRDVASVDFRVVPQRGHHFLKAYWTRAQTRSFDPRAVLQGDLRPDLRLVLLYQPRRAVFSDAVARDARGRILYRCVLPGIPALSRTAGSPTAATERRSCA
jgi:hypothetical protein